MILIEKMVNKIVASMLTYISMRWGYKEEDILEIYNNFINKV